MAIVGHLQQVGIIVGRSCGFGPRWLSQTGYVGNRLVKALVLHAFAVGVDIHTLADAGEVLLQLSWRRVLSLALLVAAMRDGGGERVADSTARTVPLALRRILGIYSRPKTLKME